MGKRNHQRNIWLDIDFIEVLRDLKRQKSVLEKKDFSDADISKLMINTPSFKEVKEELLKNNLLNQIKLRMDRRII